MNVSLIFMSQNQTLKYYDFKMGLTATIYKISTNGGYWMDSENYQHCSSAKIKVFPTLKFQLILSI